MIRKAKIAWDISHLEFTIEDHYYFSFLKSKIKEMGASVKELDSFERIVDYDVVVLNYPEKPFTRKEAKLVRKCLEVGKKIIVSGYYNNEDMIADNINSLSSHFGLSLNSDMVRDRANNDKGDDLLVITSRILSHNDHVNKVLFPCSGSINIHGDQVNPIVLLENKSLRQSKRKIIGAEAEVGVGRFILLGTCVFWDNFAIRKYSNLRFSLNLLLK
ncbi:MAG TPA: hypothetical protein VHT73_01705 [Thermodesulfobacteriota bacterium]|nr:hypothetical protein [Thermodesulfobacteriota bacterium]